MTKIRYKSASISENPQLNAPKFHFSQYEVGRTYNNNDEIIDFVTDGNSLYVCQVNAVTTSHENIAEQEGFLKLVSQGPQGVRGPRGEDGDSAVTPRIDVNFDDDQLRVKVNGETKALSPSLTGPTWKPVLEDNLLTWELTDDRYMPESIDLMNLRPIQERPLLLRTNSDNTKRSDESSGPANFIQWKYEGDEYWTNLISISELMNLTLAGVSIWQNTEGKWHFGHREVVKANYVSDKNGRKIISNVKLGDVLFDAGELPFEENSETRPDYSIDIDLIYTRLAEIERAMVKSVNGVPPGPDGDVKLNIPTLPNLDNYAQKDWVNSNFQPKGPYLTEHQSLDGLVRRVRVNGTTHSPIDGTVDLGNIGSSGSTPVDTSDCVKSVTINGTTKTPVNGNVSFTISVGETSLFDVKIENNHLWKTTDGQNWDDIGAVNTGTGGSGMSESEVKHLIGQILEGVLDSAIPEYVRTPGHNYFVRINELNSILSDYYTKSDIDAMLAGYDPSDPSTITVVSYRTFTVYTWYSVDADPATPILPTSASWDGTSNGLTLVGNTNNWSDHPGNRPNDSTRLWMATITLKSDGASSNDWNGPIDLTAYPGKDGSGVEFIYTLCVNETAFKALSTPQAAHDDNRDDDYPAHWTDQPQSIGKYSASDGIETFYNFSGNEEVLFRIEAASIRTSTNGQWNPYCKPFIWSMWGEDGMDGDGVEYIFFLADDDDVTVSNNTYSLKSNLWPDNSWAYEYQAPNSGWKDDPTGVNSTNKYEFVSKRKFHVDPETRQGSWSNWSEPALWSIYKEGPVGPIGPDGVSITSQVRYYKASNQSTGVNAPAENLDPTLSANGGWVTNSNAITLTENTQYLWFFERITYSNQNIWQSIPVIIRYFNAGTSVNYQEIEDAVEERLGDRLTQLSNRLDGVDKTYADINITSDDALVEILTDYVDSDNGNKSFAEIIVDGKGAEIAQAAGLVTSTEMTGVTQRLSAVEGSITNAVDQQTLEGAISSSEQRMTSNLISQTVTAANSKWHKVVNGQDTYQNYSPGQNETVAAYNARMIADGWELVVMADKLSAIEQKADKVSILVGEQGNVKADVIVNAINGGTVQVDANHIMLNGQVVAGSLETYFADIQNANIDGLHATNVNVEGHIHATSGSFDYLTVNGTPVGSGNNASPLNIVFGISDVPANPNANTLYFLY